MATGFMRRLHCMFVWLALAGIAGTAGAADVALIGVIGNKAAVLALDGGEPKTVKVGQTWRGISVLSVEKTRAVVQIDGTKRTLALGQHYRGSPGPGAEPAPGSSPQTVLLTVGPSGHFEAEGMINGVGVRFVVDTGASFVALPGADADRMGLDYRRGERIMAQTANGPAPAYRLRFDTIRIGAIQLTGVDGMVIERGLPIALLGMSFLDRLEMRRAGATMTLVRRF